MTGLQWVVLTAYARSLPAGSEGRVMLEDLTAKEQPAASQQRVAWILAESAGMVKAERITPHGKRAALDFMPHLVASRTKQAASSPPTLKAKATGGHHD